MTSFEESSKNDHQVRLAFVALASLIEPGNRELGELVRAVGAQAALDRLLAGGVSASLAGAATNRMRTGRRPTTVEAALALAEEQLARAKRLGTTIVVPGDDDWPRSLGDLVRISRADGSSIDRDVYPPLCLWVRGATSPSRILDRSVALVGARAASEYGSHVAGDLAYGLTTRDWTVVSGGAFGIDAAAHRGALAARGSTVAVLACGVDRPYPLAHSGLFDRIAETGLVLSEWPPSAAPYRQRFLIRNRVIAAATRGTVIVEAAARSGARQTLGRARALGRMTMAVPGPITSAMSAGCHAELRGLDSTRLVTSVDEIIEEIGHIGDLAPLPRGAIRPYDSLDALSARVLDAVPRKHARSAEEIGAAAGVSGSDARRSLPLLLAAGFVEVSDEGYRLTRRIIGHQR